jgi:hypothetical protein
MNDLIEQFRQAIAAAALTPPTEIIDDGVIHRFSTNAKPKHKNGWYMLHSDGIAAGAFGDWCAGFTQNWCSKTDTAMTEVERQAHRERVKAMQRQREDDLAQRQQLAATDAVNRWTAAKPCTLHDYLTRKGIKPNGAKIEGDTLLIPMRDTAGTGASPLRGIGPRAPVCPSAPQGGALSPAQRHAACRRRLAGVVAGLVFDGHIAIVFIAACARSVRARWIKGM